MRALEGRTLFSASDLMRFTGCAHVTTLDIAHMQGRGPVPREDSDDARLLQKQGDAHEASHLEQLRADSGRIIEIDRGDLAENAEETRIALAQGADVVFQGAFLSGGWGGWSDFLERVSTPSALGPFSYEVTDTKLKRRPHPKHVLQLVLYSDLLAELQALTELFEFLRDRLATFPMARIYHYAPYEITALRRLTIKYGIGEAFLDRLLRERRFIDLYAVVRGGLIASEPNYSIKSMEAFYGLVREPARRMR